MTTSATLLDELREPHEALVHSTRPMFGDFKEGCETCDAERRYKRLIDTRSALLTALVTIVADQGRVCPEFETCEHASCRSSYASWQIADETLEACSA